MQLGMFVELVDLRNFWKFHLDRTNNYDSTVYASVHDLFDRKAELSVTRCIAQPCIITITVSSSAALMVFGENPRS
jgi:hypothetical protein